VAVGAQNGPCIKAALGTPSAIFARVMQRCMLDILAEVQAEVHRDREILWSSSKCSSKHDNAGGSQTAPSVDVPAYTASIDHTNVISQELARRPSLEAGSTASGLKPLGSVLRLHREEEHRRERQNLVAALSARQAAACNATPSTARRRPPRSQGRRVESPGLGLATLAPSTPRQPPKPRLVHRHHHRHFHHHYVLGPDDEADFTLDTTIEHSAAESSKTSFGADAARDGDIGDGGGDPNMHHVHYHKHICEEEILPRARRLLVHAQQALKSSVTEQENIETEREAGFAGPNTRLPRLT